jgi:predicted RNA binding protein YcfA (HicA-like mRNA interferase family)
MPERKITPIHYQDLIRVFERDGFAVKRKKGDHIIMTKEGIKRPIVIKSSPRLVPVDELKEARKLVNRSLLWSEDRIYDQIGG